MSTCSHCGGSLLFAGSIPPLAMCSQCGRQFVGSALGVVPPCPKCAGAMPVVMEQFPITVRCAACETGFFFDAVRGTLVSSAGYGPTWPPPPCPSCNGSLSSSWCRLLRRRDQKRAELGIVGVCDRSIDIIRGVGRVVIHPSPIFAEPISTLKRSQPGIVRRYRTMFPEDRALRVQVESRAPAS